MTLADTATVAALISTGVGMVLGLVAIGRRIGAMDGKQDQVLHDLGQLKDRLEDIEKGRESHGKRIGEIEARVAVLEDRTRGVRA